MDIRLELLKPDDEEQFIKDNQVAFNFGAEQYFNEQELEEQHEEDGQIISRETIIQSIHHERSIAYRIMDGDKKVGGIIVNLKDDFGELEIFFVKGGKSLCDHDAFLQKWMASDSGCGALIDK